MDALTLLQAIGAPKLWHDIGRYRRAVQPTGRAVSPSSRRLQDSPVTFGNMAPNRSLRISKRDCVGHGLIGGATGGGKTWAGLSLMPQFPAVGVIDSKGDLYRGARRLLERLHPD